MNQYDHLRPVGNRSHIGCGRLQNNKRRCLKRYVCVPTIQKIWQIELIWIPSLPELLKSCTDGHSDKKETPSKGCLCNIYTISRRISAASSASARCSQNIEAAGTPGPTEGSGRHAPYRGCQRQLTGVKIVVKKKPGGKPGEFFACYKRNKFIC